MRFFVARVFPVQVAVGLLMILALSNVPPTLFFLGEGATSIIFIFYAALLVMVALFGSRLDHRVHPLGGAVAFLVFGGRAGGFLELVIESSRPDLFPAVAERLLLVSTMVMWHYFMAQWAALDITPDLRRGG